MLYKYYYKNTAILLARYLVYVPTPPAEMTTRNKKIRKNETTKESPHVFVSKQQPHQKEHIAADP